MARLSLNKYSKRKHPFIFSLCGANASSLRKKKFLSSRLFIVAFYNYQIFLIARASVGLQVQVGIPLLPLKNMYFFLVTINVPHFISFFKGDIFISYFQFIMQHMCSFTSHLFYLSFDCCSTIFFQF